MTTPELPKKPDGAVQFFARLAETFVYGHALAETITVAALVERAVDEVLAAHLMPTPGWERTTFQTAVLPIMSREQRRNLLKPVIEHAGYTDGAAQLVERILKVYAVRDRVAHGFLDRTADGQMNIVDYKKGAERTTDFTELEIEVVLQDGPELLNTLAQYMGHNDRLP